VETTTEAEKSPAAGLVSAVLSDGAVLAKPITIATACSNQPAAAPVAAGFLTYQTSKPGEIVDPGAFALVLIIFALVHFIEDRSPI
jgi:hypothetical protein